MSTQNAEETFNTKCRKHFRCSFVVLFDFKDTFDTRIYATHTYVNVTICHEVRQEDITHRWDSLSMPTQKTARQCPTTHTLLGTVPNRHQDQRPKTQNSEINLIPRHSVRDYSSQPVWEYVGGLTAPLQRFCCNDADVRLISEHAPDLLAPLRGCYRNAPGVSTTSDQRLSDEGDATKTVIR